MGIRFNADDVLSVAERIEQNGMVFYEAAASKVSAPEAISLLIRLSAWEAEHATIFAAMRSELTDKEREATAYDPADEATLYLQAMADVAVFHLDEDPFLVLGPSPPLSAILTEAMKREQASIHFYTKMESIVPASLGFDRIEQIIQEEYHHLELLEEVSTKASRAI
ncbi:MAG: ferritin family protein [Armatimonadota bacterium]